MECPWRCLQMVLWVSASLTEPCIQTISDHTGHPVLPCPSTVTPLRAWQELVGWASVINFFCFQTCSVSNQLGPEMSPTVVWCHPDSLQILKGHPQTWGPEGSLCHHVGSVHKFSFPHAMRTLQFPRLHRTTWDWAQHALVSHLHGCRINDYQQHVRAFPD